MTTTEQKVYDSLNDLDLTLSEINEKDLKKRYLELAKKYHPDTCSNNAYKDGLMFQKMKSSYDYLSNNINITNEVIHNLNNPNNKTYNYYNDDINNDYNYNNFNQNYSTVHIYDCRPSFSMFHAVLSFLFPLYGLFLFFITRPLNKKYGYIYLFVGIIGFILNILIL